MSKIGELGIDSVTLWSKLWCFTVKFHKTRHFDMSRHPCTMVKYSNHSIYQRDNNLVH